ncbi:MAG TPA: UPF0182 family protein, partial [Blastocatellia bacterium]|nr:UPF0182 family protein [Blastocatellia bacterium]
QSSTQPEFNYPAPDNTDSYNEYDGKAGIAVGGFFRKTALSIFLGDGTNLLFSDYIDSNSRVMIRRNILTRVRSIAPFLMYETDPYIVIGQDGRLYWMIDAFTHSNRYPYSTGYTVANRSVNYIRNSVKVVLDAYEGEVKFYVFDPDDPIIKSYQSIFPSLFVASDEMPADLRSHIRYPDMLADAQAHAYTLYHVESAQTFYNREDLWAIPAIDQPAQQGPAQPGAEAAQMEPYYVLMQLPSESEKNLEFISILPFTPAGPGRNNMIGWMAARSDGDKYGQTLVFTFPKNVTVAGPMQIKARINQDAKLSAQLSLWDRAGSKVLRGNLQVIPIADSLLYIEPFYLAAENSQLPELRQVAVATQDRLATDVSFESALRALVSELGGQKPSVDAQAAQPPAAPPGQVPGQPPAQSPAQPPAQQPGQTAPPADTAALARQAQQLFAEYERLAAAGRHREAGEKLDQLKQVLAELARARGGQ